MWIQCQSLWLRPHFQFFPMAWLGFGYFVSLRLEKPESCQSRFRAACGLFAIVFSLATTLESILISSPWLTYVAAVVLIIGWLLIRGGTMKWSSAIGLSSLLWITVPLPAGYDNKLIQFLQAQSSYVASLVLDCVGILHIREGNVLELVQKRLFVDEACSGVDSLYALMAICLTIVLWLRQKLPVAILSLSLVPIWASCSNIARLITIVLGLQWFKVDLSHGTQHTILGLIVFVGAFLCDFAFIRFAGSIFSNRADDLLAQRAAHSSEHRKSPSLRTIKLIGCCVFMGCFLAVGGYSTRALSLQSLHRFPHFSKDLIATMNQLQNLPKRMEQWQFESFQVVERNRESAFGQYSNVWAYRSPIGPVTISADFPFRGFHLLDICYQGAGWKLVGWPSQVELTCSTEEKKETNPFYAHLMSMKNDEGNFAFVAYTLFQLDGTPIRSAARGNQGFERFEQTILEPVSYQVQVFVSSSEEINKDTQQLTQKNLETIVGLLKPGFQFLKTHENANQP